MTKSFETKKNGFPQGRYDDCQEILPLFLRTYRREKA
jgi:hypothetical protein